MYLIENNFMIDLFAKDLCNDSLDHYDDIQLHLLHHQYETEYTNYLKVHLDNEGVSQRCSKFDVK